MREKNFGRNEKSLFLKFKMINKFNVSRYHELLKKEDILEEQSKFLFDDPDYLELLSYQATVSRQIYFSRKSDYCSSIKKYLNTTIPPPTTPQ